MISGLFGQNPKNKEEKPTAAFSAVFWDRFMGARVSYAPWGNHSDENATFREVQIGFSSPSQKFVYYGKETLNFYDAREVSNSTEQENEKERIPVAQFEFTHNEDEPMKEYLLLLIKQSGKGLKYKLHAIPFSYSDVPASSLKCYSQLRETIYVAFEKARLSIPPGKSKLIQGEFGAGSERYLLEGYFREQGKYVKELSQQMQFSSNQRGILLFSKERNRLRVKSYLETRQSLINAIGYGVAPLLTSMEEKEEEIPDGNGTNATQLVP